MATTTTVMKQVETNANQILDTIRTNPNITLPELQDRMGTAKISPKNMKLSQLRIYIRHLLKHRYIKKSLVRPHKYKLQNDTPFIYTPILIQSKKRDRSKQQ